MKCSNLLKTQYSIIGTVSDISMGKTKQLLTDWNYQQKSFERMQNTQDST